MGRKIHPYLPMRELLLHCECQGISLLPLKVPDLDATFQCQRVEAHAHVIRLGFTERSTLNATAYPCEAS